MLGFAYGWNTVDLTKILEKILWRCNITNTSSLTFHPTTTVRYNITKVGLCIYCIQQVCQLQQLSKNSNFASDTMPLSDTILFLNLTTLHQTITMISYINLCYVMQHAT